MRVVLDTNILARAANGLPSLASEIFERCSRPPSTVLVSEFLLIEVERALRYPRVRRVHGLTDEEINLFLADIRKATELVIPEPSPSPVTADPDDDAIVALAIEGTRRCSAPEIATF